MPVAATPVVTSPGPSPSQIERAIILRLIALNSADAQLQALVAQYKVITGLDFG